MSFAAFSAVSPLVLARSLAPTRYAGTLSPFSEDTAMNAFTRSSVLLLLALSALVLASCAHTILPDEVASARQTSVQPTLDSLSVTVVSVTALGGGMATYPPTPPAASISLVLAVKNNSALATDSLVVCRGAAMNVAGDSAKLQFQFRHVAYLSGDDWNSRLKPGQQDTIWCNAGFDWQALTCGDSIFVRVQLVDQAGHSLYIDSPVTRYSCSW